jgi:hypothetical protein
MSRKILKDGPDLGASLTPRQAAALFTIGLETLGKMRREGRFIKGVHYQERAGTGGRSGYVYFQRACTHLRDNMGDPVAHDRWLNREFLGPNHANQN